MWCCLEDKASTHATVNVDSARGKHSENMIKRWVIFTFYATSLLQLGTTRNYKAAEEKHLKHLRNSMRTGVVQVSRNIVTVLHLQKKINILSRGTALF